MREMQMRVSHFAILVIIIGVEKNYNGELTRDFLIKAHEHGMTGGEFVYLIPWMLKNQVGTVPPWEVGDGNDIKVLEAFQQAFVVKIDNAEQ